MCPEQLREVSQSGVLPRWQRVLSIWGRSRHVCTGGLYHDDGVPCHSCTAGGIGGILHLCCSPNLVIAEDLLLESLLPIPVSLELPAPVEARSDDLDGRWRRHRRQRGCQVISRAAS